MRGVGDALVGVCGWAKGFELGQPPRRSRRQLGDAAGEIGKAGLIGKGARQGDLDAGDHLGDAPGDLDQAEADRIELALS